MKKLCDTCHFLSQSCCRRYPPPSSGTWPVVKDDDFCGEWKVSQEAGTDVKEAFKEDFFNLIRKYRGRFGSNFITRVGGEPEDKMRTLSQLMLRFDKKRLYMQDVWSDAPEDLGG